MTGLSPATRFQPGSKVCTVRLGACAGILYDVRWDTARNRSLLLCFKPTAVSTWQELVKSQPQCTITYVMLNLIFGIDKRFKRQHRARCLLDMQAIHAFFQLAVPFLYIIHELLGSVFDIPIYQLSNKNISIVCWSLSTTKLSTYFMTATRVTFFISFLRYFVNFSSSKWLLFLASGWIVLFIVVLLVLHLFSGR